MNRTCEDQWGMAFVDLQGTDASQFFPEEQMEWFLAKDQEVFTGREPIDFVEPIWNATLKENRTGHTFKKPIYDGQGNPLYLIGITIDITDHSRAEANLRESEEKLRGLYELSPLGIALTDMHGHYVEFNQAFSAICGYSAQELNSLNYWALTPKKYEHEETRQLRSLQSTGRYGPYEKEYIRKDGTLVPLQLSGMLIFGKDGQKYIWSLVEDITARKKSEADLQIAATAFEAQIGIMVTDANGVILRVNQTFTRETGYTAEEAIGKTPSMLKSGRHDSAFYTAMWKSIRRDGVWQGEIWDRRKNGEIYPKWLTITAVKDNEGVTTHYIGTQTDITERKVAEDRIEGLAFYDQLTGLPNRVLFLDRLKQVAATSARSGNRGAVLFIDLDHFKTVNDTLGHNIGDELLREVAARLRLCVREGDTVARFGGDEFVVLLEGLSEKSNEAATQAEKVSEKILCDLGKPYVLLGQEHISTPSIGITLIDEQYAGIEELLQQADLAMYQAKTDGRNSMRFFDSEMQSVVTRRARLEMDLRVGLRETQFVLYYQAQVDGCESCTGAEVLLRWQHPLRGLVLPDDFIPLAEEAGLILPFGNWVLETACGQLAAWAKRQDVSHLTLAVNVSARQLHQKDFVERVLSALDRTGADPGKLRLELTESHLLSEVDDTIAKMSRLRDRGVNFVLDDFGTGYSSLTYLKRLPLEKLKIDRSFVTDVLIDPNDAAIAKTIVALAHGLGLKVLAEGVETKEQRDFLAESGCHWYQGFLFCRPLPLEAFEEYLRKS